MSTPHDDLPHEDGAAALPLPPVPTSVATSAATAMAAPRRLHPWSPVVDLAVWLPRLWAPILFAATRPRGALLVGVVVIAVLAARIIAWTRTTWSFDGDELTVSRGVWNRVVRRVPVVRLQQVEVMRKLRHQALGVAVVRVQLADAGSNDGDVVLEAVSQSDAEQLKAALEHHRRSAALGAGAAALVPPPPEHVLLRVGPALLALGGVTGASLLLVPAGLGAAYGVLDDVGLDDDAGEAVSRLGLAGAVVVVSLAAFVVAPVLAVVRHHGFRLARRTTDLVFERGVFERRSSTVPIARVQLVRVQRNLVRRLLGIASVDVATSGRVTADGAGSAGDSVPVARWADALAVARTSMGEREVPAADERAVPAAVRRLVRRRVVVALVLCAGLPFVLPWLLAAVVCAAVVAVVAGVAVASGRARRHGVGTEVIVVEDGALGWRRSLVPIDRVQSWSVGDQPFQRRVGLCTVSLHLAGNRAVRVVDASVAQAMRVLAALEPAVAPGGAPARRKSVERSG